MNIKIIAIILLLINDLRLSQSKTYYNYTLFNVKPVDHEHLEFLQRIYNQRFIDVIFWIKPTKLFNNVQLMVNPIDTELFMERANHYKMSFQILLKNIQRAFDEQNIQKYARFKASPYSWRNYHALEDIYQWLADMAEKYPEIVELTSIGKSAEGRDIFAIIVRTEHSRTRVIADGGIHGNEWITVEIVTFIVDQLIKNITKKTRVGYRLRKYEWNLIPILNPDGYVYTHTTDRLWRKNRRIITYTNTIGVDLNRNFDYDFKEYGTSENPKDEHYCGPHAFSEPESSILANFTRQKRNNLKFYFSFHAYGQKIIIPYSDKIHHRSNYVQAKLFGQRAALEIKKVNGVKYEVGTMYDMLGDLISGDSASYIKKIHRIKFVYTFLLRDNGTYGHALPSNQILPTCKEVFTGVVDIVTDKPKRQQMHLMSTGGVGSPLLARRFLLILFCLFVLIDMFLFVR